MKNTTLVLLLISCLSASSLFAQEVKSESRTARTYAAMQPIANEKAAALHNEFEPMNFSMLNVQAMTSAAGDVNYLLKGNKISGDHLTLFPAKFRRMGRRSDTDIYAAAVIAGDGDPLYIVRTVKGQQERIDLFRLFGETMQQVKTLALYNCNGNKCKEVQSYLTDFNGDGRPDIARLYRTTGKNDRVLKTKREIFVMDLNKNYQKSNRDLEPTMENSIEFID